MTVLTEVTLECGCVCLCDSDGPCSVVTPCPKYPDNRDTDLRGVENWQKALERHRRHKNKARAAHHQRTRSRRTTT